MEPQLAREREAWGAFDRIIIGSLLLGALALRWLSSGGPVLGDESWYFYLARTLGTEPAAAADNAWFHLANRPLYYAIFHLGTFAGFTGFRWFASVVGAMHVGLTYGIARALGARRIGAACAAAVLAVQREVVEYGAHGFPDPLASMFALTAVFTAFKQRPALTCLLASACVLCKESFVAVPLIATYVRLSTGGSGLLKKDPWTWLTLFLPIAYVGAIMFAGVRTPGIMLQGWAQTAMSWKHARGMWIGPEMWPLMAFCLYARRTTWLVIWLGLPAFYALWSFGLGRGLAPWYVIGPASLSAVAVSLVLSDAERELRGRLLYLAIPTLLVPIIWSGVFRSGSQLSALRQTWPKVEAGAEVQTLLERSSPARVLLVNCFWSFGYSHLRTASVPAGRAYWPESADLLPLRAAALASEVTVVCRAPDTHAKEQALASQGFQTLLKNEQYWVLGHNVGVAVQPRPPR